MANSSNCFRKIFVSVTLVFCILLNGCASFPLSDIADIAQETKIQQKATDSIKAKLTYKDQSDSYDEQRLKDEKIQDYVSDVADKVGTAVNVNASKINVSDSSVIQASTGNLTGIVITRGMLNMIHSEAELAALIGHEIGHKALNHTHSRKKSEKEKMGDDLASHLNPIDKIDIVSWKNDISDGNWNQNKEQAADEYGAVAAFKAGYNPYSFVDLFDRLASKIIDNPLYRLEKIRGSHKALSARASHLRKFLLQKGYKNSNGLIAKTEYTSAVNSLVTSEKKRLSKSPCSKNSARQIQIINKIDAFSNEITLLQASKKPLEIQRFILMMKETSEIARTCKIKVKKNFPGPIHQYSQKTFKNYKHFMEERLTQDFPTWGDAGFDPLQQKLNSFLETMGRVAVGFIPVVNDAVDLYEVVSGRDFLTGDKLSTTDRLLSGVGLLAASGAFWREGKSLLKTAEILGDESRNVNQIVSELNRIDEVASNVRPVLGNQFVRDLPDLKGDYFDAFEGRIFKGTYEPGDILFQAQRTGQIGPGNWFTPVRPINAEHAEELLNIAKHNNDAGQIKTYVVKERVSGYAGKVDGGEGHQFFVPESVPLDKIFEEVK